MDHRELWAAELRLSCSEATVRAYTGALAELLRHASEDDPAQLVRGDVVAWLAQPHLSAKMTGTCVRRGTCCRTCGGPASRLPA